MENSSNGQHRETKNILNTAGNWVTAITKFGPTVIKYIKKNPGPAGVLFFIVIALLAGGVGGYVLNGQLSAPAPSVAAVVPVQTSVPNVGVLDGVTITDTSAKMLPGHPGQPDMVGIAFSPPNPCDYACNAALADLLGANSCEGQNCQAELVDVDEGAKTNSGDIFQDCKTYEAQGQKVMIVFSGVRDQNKSDYANVLLIKPSAR